MAGGKRSQMQKDQAWLTSQNLTEYAGHWIAIFKQTVIADGECLSDVTKKVRKSKLDDQDPLYIRVPDSLIST